MIIDLPITERQDQLDMWAAEVIPAMVRCVLQGKDCIDLERMPDMCAEVFRDKVSCGMNHIAGLLSSDVCARIVRECVECVRRRRVKHRLIGEEELDDDVHLSLAVVMLEQFVKDSSLDKLLLKKLNDAIRPYHEEKGAALKMEAGRVINDMSLLKNTMKHLFLYMKCLSWATLTRRFLSRASAVAFLQQEQQTYLSLLLSPNTLVTPLVVNSLLDLFAGCAEDRLDWSVVTSLVTNLENTRQMIAAQLTANADVCNALVHLFFTPVAAYLDEHCSTHTVRSPKDATIDLPALHSLLTAYMKVAFASLSHG